MVGEANSHIPEPPVPHSCSPRPAEPSSSPGAHRRNSLAGLRSSREKSIPASVQPVGAVLSPGLQGQGLGASPSPPGLACAPPTSLPSPVSEAVIASSSEALCSLSEVTPEGVHTGRHRGPRGVSVTKERWLDWASPSHQTSSPRHSIHPQRAPRAHVEMKGQTHSSPVPDSCDFPSL